MKKRILALFLSLLLIIPANAFASSPQDPEGFAVITTLFNFIKHFYQFEVDDSKASENIIKEVLRENPDAFETIVDAFMGALDEHSVYYTKEEFEGFNNYIESGFAGIGITYLRENGKMVVSGTVENSPASKAGILPGDVIAAVDGISLYECDTDYAASLIRGKEGTSIVVTVERGEEKFDVTLIRATLHDITVNYSMLKDDIAYFNITMFGSETAEEFDAAYEELQQYNPKGYIIDLRYNTGGVTDEALSCLSYFLPKDAVTMNIYSKAQGTEVYKNKKDGKKQNVAVLVNEYSASASEIFTAAIKDNSAGVIVGTKTYGKGTSQTTVGLGEYGGVKLTIAEFQSPKGNRIDGVGISPDVYVKNVPKKAEAGDYEKLEYKTVYKQGDSGDEIYAIKQRLSATGHFKGTMDNYYDLSLVNAVKAIQKETGLFVYGVADITTQTVINNLALEAEIMIDSQLEEAHKQVKNNIK